MSWPTRRLGDLVAFRNGLSYSRADRGGDLPIIGVGDVSRGGDLASSGYERIAMPSELSEEAIVQKGDLVFVRSSGSKHLVGRCARVGDMEVPTSHSGFTIRARVVAPEINPDWVAAFFQNGMADSALGRGARGTNINNLRQEKLAGIDLPCPPRDLQDRMIELIRAATEVCARIDEAVTTRAKFKRGLMQDLLTGRRRFPEFGQVGGGESSPFGVLPKGWQLMRLGELTSEVKKRNQGQHGADRVKGVIKGRGLEPMREHVRGDDLRRYLVVPPEGFAYNPMRLNIGSLAFNRSGKECLVSPDYVVFEARGGASARYLDQLRHSVVWDRFIHAAGSGSVRVRIYYPALAGMVVPLPPSSEQERIVAVLDGLDREIGNLQEVAIQMRKQKRGLMQRLFSGDLDLSKLGDRAVESRT